MKRIFFAVSVFLICVSVFSQGHQLSNVPLPEIKSVSLTYSGSGGYTLVERSNLRRYINGKYSGLTSREVRSFISPSAAFRDGNEDAFWYEGSFYVMEETLRNLEISFAGINESIDSSFCIDPDGKMTVFTDNGYPTFRSFPSFPDRKIQAGDQWSSSAVRSVDPLNKGVHTKLDMYVLYTFYGEELYQEKEVYRIKAQWQTNYGGTHIDPTGDRALKKARGGHKADILVKKETGEVILVLDTVDETFFYADNSQVNFKGNITLFTEYPPAINHDKLYDKLKTAGGIFAEETQSLDSGYGTPEQISSSGIGSKTDGGTGTGSGVPYNPDSPASSGFDSRLAEAIQAGTEGIFLTDGQTEIDDGTGKKFLIQKTEAGVRLSLRDIKFIPDSDEVLPEERYRIEKIASVLKNIEGHQFLIEGHTASVGKASGEKVLSLQRAQKIAREFINYGIPSGRFICKGWGGTKPVADNTTDEGRAQNRRVEITILE